MRAQLETIRALHQQGGPTKLDYPLLEKTIAELHHSLETEKDYAEVINQVAAFAPGLVNRETMQGFVIEKPHGYAGDFEVIERLYDRYTSDQYGAWDVFWHAQPAAIAVRNRKQYFKSLMRKTTSAKTDARVLNIASGPVRDLYEFLQENPDSAVKVDCVDQDPNAIRFATERCAQYTKQVQFYCDNALRFESSRQYELVWSAGLFDYFDDAIFVKALQKLLAYTKHGGEVVVGNFSDNNPTKPYMEVMAWHLHHRSQEELVELAVASGVQREHVWIGREPEGVNLFLHIQKL